VADKTYDDPPIDSAEYLGVEPPLYASALTPEQRAAMETARDSAE
jgi:hypothetical protein